MRRIDADAFENVEMPVNGYWDESRECFVYQPPTWVQAFEVINKFPTIDAVPVVRCRECRWHEDEQPGMVYCPATVGGWVENDWFCKGGQRREDGDGA